MCRRGKSSVESPSCHVSDPWAILCRYTRVINSRFPLMSTASLHVVGHECHMPLLSSTLTEKQATYRPLKTGMTHTHTHTPRACGHDLRLQWHLDAPLILLTLKKRGICSHYFTLKPYQKACSHSGLVFQAYVVTSCVCRAPSDPSGQDLAEASRSPTCPSGKEVLAASCSCGRLGCVPSDPGVSACSHAAQCNRRSLKSSDYPGQHYQTIGIPN